MKGVYLCLALIAAVVFGAFSVWAAPKAAKGGKSCYFVGGNPAAQTEAMLQKALDLKAKGGDAALQQLRNEESVIVPHGGAASKVSCPEGKNRCQFEYGGKTWWMELQGMQCN